MPPKAKITREMILDAAFRIAREQGAERVNARTVSQALGCSTQPVLYCFDTIEALRRAVYEKADRFHTAYLLDVRPQEDVMLTIGVNYIRFAVEETHLFRFLFQSGLARENSVPQMMDSRELEPVLAAMGEAMGLSRERTKEVFLTLALFAHGYASILANNGLAYDEELVKVHLERAYRGAVAAIEEELS